MPDLVYGIVFKGVFYSGRMRRPCRGMPNGVYSMDMSAEDFASTLSPADIAEASKYFRRSSRMEVVRGISFRDGFVPENPVAYPAVPISVVDPTYDEFEEVEAVKFSVETPARDAVVPDGTAQRQTDAYYFLQTVETNKAYILMELKGEAEAKQPRPITDFKGVTPEMRIVFTLHRAAIVAERKRKEEQEPANAVKAMMEEVGATVEKVKPTNRGFEVTWKFEKYRFLTIFDKQIKVVHAGYCVRAQDKLLSARSIVNVLKDGIKQHGDDGMIHATAAYDGEHFGADEDPDEE